MIYTMTTPCNECPYLIGSGFEWDSLVAHASGEFGCHKACDLNEDDEDYSGVYEPNEKTPHCAGALIFNELRNQPHQMQRICERLGLYDRRKLNMNASVIKCHADAGKRK